MIQPLCTLGAGCGGAAGTLAVRVAGALAGAGGGRGGGASARAIAWFAASGAGSGGEDENGQSEAVRTPSLPPPGLTESVFTATGRIGSVEPAAGDGRARAVAGGCRARRVRSAAA